MTEEGMLTVDSFQIELEYLRRKYNRSGYTGLGVLRIENTFMVSFDMRSGISDFVENINDSPYDRYGKII